MGDRPEQRLSAEARQQRDRIQRGLLRANAAAVIILCVLITLAAAAIVAAWRADQNARVAMEASGQADQQRRRAEAELWKARLAESRSIRGSGAVGQRDRTLAALREAAAIHPAQELCDEATAALAQIDFSAQSPLHRFQTESIPYAVDTTLTRFAIGQTNGEIVVRQLSDGSDLARLSLPAGRPFDQNQPRRLFFSPDGGKLGVVYHTGLAGVFHLTGSNRFDALSPSIRSSRDGLSPIAFSHDGRLVGLLPAGGNTPQLFDLKRLRRVGTNLEISDLRAMAFHPQTNWLAVGGYRQTRIISLATGAVIHVLTNTETVTSVCFRPDGRQLAIAAGEAGVTLWSLRFPDEPAGTHLPVGQVYELRYSTSGDYLTASTGEGVSLIWDAHNGRLVRRVTGARVIEVNDEQGRVVLERPREGIQLSRLDRSEILRTFWCGTEHAGQRRLWCVDFSDDGRWMASADHRHFVIWDVASARVLDVNPTASRRMTVGWLPKERAWITSGWKGLSIWPMISLSNETFRMERHRDIPLEIHPNLGQAALSLDGEKLAAVVESGEVRVTTLGLTQSVVRLKGPGALGHVAFSPDGRKLAGSSTSGDGILIWDVAMDAAPLRLAGPHGRVAWSPDGHWLAHGADRGYTFWNTTNWQRDETKTLSRGNMTDTTGALAYSPDGSLLAVARERELVQLLDGRSGRELVSLHSPDPQGIGWLRFSRDSKMLAAATLEGTVQLWEIGRLRERLAQFNLDWDRVDTRAWPNTESPTPSNTAGTSLTRFIALAMVGVILAFAAAIFALRRQRHLLLAYLQLDDVAEERSRELETARTTLAHAEKMKALGTLAAGIAHDFNNVLSVIRMSNQLTGESARDNVDITENVSEVEQAVQQGKKLVRSMLGYSREDPDDTKPFSLPELVEDTVGLLSKQFLSGIALKLDLDRNTPLVRASRSRLEQMLLNLVVNAAEAMDGHGELHICVRFAGSPVENAPRVPATSSSEGPQGFDSVNLSQGQPAAHVVLPPRSETRCIDVSVGDSGAGIPADVLPRIFDPFFTTKHRGAERGTGLGLSMVYAMAQKEGFGLGVDARPGHGACFHILIPVTTEPAA